ncbi:Putative dihydroorotate dehydrogenase A (fumarate) [Vanrija pseudolonga]|uniref:Dihydroorotate dehydrogenase (fumarate) n=1 Tax=Vanrija pseudolonga TaxID=143232 RepID=A0AAF0Y7G2_9TREE|nr:Putative dihydroorotate dehydrogenase A (fumarate) [Vanrija pseudolonga]
MPPRLALDPPLLNAACPWATDLSYLRALYASPSTGAITTRTSLVDGYPHDDAVNTFVFFDPAHPSSVTGVFPQSFPASADSNSASLNSFGLSPIKLAEYLSFAATLADEALAAGRKPKPIVISVTGSTPQDTGAAIRAVLAAAPRIKAPLAIEVNLSCPNVPGHPPPAYDATGLADYLAAFPSNPPLPVGLKTPPYTHADQFAMLVAAVAANRDKVSFLTSTNTLGNCLVLQGEAPALPELGFGGMAGPAIHPLSLGNVATLRRLLDASGLADVDLVGVGGVADAAGYARMRAAGARFVGVATALGRHGPAVFDAILAPRARL